MRKNILLVSLLLIALCSCGTDKSNQEEKVGGNGKIIEIQVDNSNVLEEEVSSSTESTLGDEFKKFPSREEFIK